MRVCVVYGTQTVVKSLFLCASVRVPPLDLVSTGDEAAIGYMSRARPQGTD